MRKCDEPIERSKGAGADYIGGEARDIFQPVTHDLRMVGYSGLFDNLIEKLHPALPRFNHAHLIGRQDRNDDAGKTGARSEVKPDFSGSATGA